MSHTSLPATFRRYRVLHKVDVHHQRRVIKHGATLHFAETLATTICYEARQELSLEPVVGYDRNGKVEMYYYDQHGWAFSDKQLAGLVDRRVLEKCL